MKKLLNILCLLVMGACACAFAIDYESEITTCIQNNDFSKSEELLNEWKSKEPENIEINIYYFNYYFHRNSQHTMTMGQMKDGRYGLYDNVTYDMDDVKIALEYLDKVTAVLPDRLDVRFGKIHGLLISDQYKNATPEIIGLIKYSKTNGNKWLWAHNKTLAESGMSDGESVLISALNDYFNQYLYDFEGNKTYIKQIAECEMKNYPDNTWVLNHGASYYRGVKNYKKTLQLLERAMKIDPEDYILVGNYAYTFELSGDYVNARKWYTYMLSMDDPDARAYGQTGLQYIEGK